MTKSLSSFSPKIAAALSALLLSLGLFPGLASAQEMPSYAMPQDGGGGSVEVHGTIAEINGTWNITVDDANGYADNVVLHQGTVINPTGITLEPGMQVTIDGYDDGGALDAQVINTPYQYGGPAPAPVFYGPGWWYPGFAYGYGPAFSLTIGNGFIVERHPWVGHWYITHPLSFAPAPPVFRPRPAGFGYGGGGYRGPAPVGRAPQGNFHASYNGAPAYQRPAFNGGQPPAQHQWGGGGQAPARQWSGGGAASARGGSYHTAPVARAPMTASRGSSHAAARGGGEQRDDHSHR
jgi:hypothetical protein